ncbi:hypothetical protein SDC9_173118 [bioreactor metagenome]|uniref:Uncharacterized protein n=1 Tax=bioreactor metagenome TaxID=1076179 RepID=A0A645GP25_9ZZZZ
MSAKLSADGSGFRASELRFISDSLQSPDNIFQDGYRGAQMRGVMRAVDVIRKLRLQFR